MLTRLLPLMFLVGCPDPTAAPEGGGMSDKPMGGGAPPGGPGAEGQAPGQPGQPGGEGTPPQGMGGRPVPPGFQVTAGEGIKLSGTLAYTGAKTGTITIDFLRQGENTNFPDLVHSLTLTQPGPWEVETPKDAGNVWVVAFLDGNANGPDPSEPAGRVQDIVKVESASIAGLDITLTDSPDLGELKPGGKDGPPGPGAPGAGGTPGAPPTGPMVDGKPADAPTGALPTGPGGSAPPGAGKDDPPKDK